MAEDFPKFPPPNWNSREQEPGPQRLDPDTLPKIKVPGPQRVDLDTLPKIAVPVTAAQEQTIGSGEMVSNEMPPKDVTDAVMLLTEVCKEWTPTPLPKPDPGASPQMPIVHNQSYVLHHNVCSLATNPVGFNDQIENVFLGGMGAAVALIIGVWLVLRAGNWLRKKVFRRKEDSALVLKHRLDADAARQAPGAAE